MAYSTGSVYRKELTLIMSRLNLPLDRNANLCGCLISGASIRRGTPQHEHSISATQKWVICAYLKINKIY